MKTMDIFKITVASIFLSSALLCSAASLVNKTYAMVQSSSSSGLKVTIPIYSSKIDSEDEEAESRVIEVSLEAFTKLHDKGYIWSSLAQKWIEVNPKDFNEKDKESKLKKTAQAIFLAEEEALLDIFNSSEDEIRLRTKTLSKGATID